MTDYRTFLGRTRKNLAREGKGWPINAVFLGAAGLFLILATLELVQEGTVSRFVFLFATGFALQGIAESLTQDRRSLRLRVRLLAATVFVFGFVLSMSVLFGGPNLLF